jgi:uncharacterized repeat protein (TIGR01451 family)
VLSKTSLGTVPANGSNWVYNGGSFTPTITYSISARNDYSPTGRETIFTPNIVDDVSDIIDTLISDCGVSPITVGARFGIPVGATIDIPTKKITWSGLNSITPGQSLGVTYTVDYSGCPDGLVFDNSATISSPNISNVGATSQVRTGFNPLPVGSFAKGETIGSSSAIQANIDDLPAVIQNYGSVFSYQLLTTNPSPLALGNVVMLDKIQPEIEFVGASVPSSLGATVYYNVSGAANSDTIAPDYDPATGVFGPTWTTTVPSPASDVAWVAVATPCLDSSLFPAASGSCYQKPTSINATIQVKVKTPAGACDLITTANKGLFYVYSAGEDVTNSSLNTLGTPLSQLGDIEVSHIGPATANLSTTSINGPTSLEVGDSGLYTITISNNGTDASLNTQAVITLPTLQRNGVLTPVDFVSASGGTVSLAGLPDSITVAVGSVPAGTTKNVTVTLSIPSGIPVSSIGTLTAVVTGQDDASCSTIAATTTKATTYSAEPKISSYKEVDEALVDTAGQIHYTIHYTNMGESPTTQTYVVDRVPTATVFNEAYTTGTDSNGNTFTCTGCSVFFANDNPSLPIGISPFDQFTVPRITNNFVSGIETSPGVWNSPFGASTKYIAYKVDNPSIGGGLVPTAFNGTVGLSVTNDADGSGPSTNGSPTGAIITNQTAIVSQELSQAIGNQAFTTILSDPGLKLEKSSSKDTLYAGEQFDWNIQYSNDSANSDTSVTITDVVPNGFTVSGVYNTWNTKAINGGATPSGEINITANPNTTITNNADGTTTVVVHISQGLRGGDLALLEGGTIRIDTSSASTLPSGLTIINTAEGCFANTVASYCVYASDPVSIQNPDLWIRKNVDISQPVSGQTILYSLIVSNEGHHDATNVTITDTLPAGLCYVAGSTSIGSPFGWTISEPIVTGSCGSQQTLSWSNTTSNALSSPTLPSGVIGSNSPDIYVTYQAQVDLSVSAGTVLTNGASISNSLTENPLYPNNDTRPVTVPFADPYVIKTSQPIALPGSSYAYTLTYGNNTLQSGSDVYLIDTLPDSDASGDSDITLDAVSGTHGETFYYNDATSSAVAPTFDPLNPTSGGWSATPLPHTNYVAALVGALPGEAGPFNIILNTSMTDPETLSNTAPGTSMTNAVSIASKDTDNDVTNNGSSSTTSTPSLDLAVSKTADIEGDYPGTQPGNYIAYTVHFSNSGTVNACDIYIEDTLPSEIDASLAIHNLTDLSGLKDSSNVTVLPVDTSGTNITTPVSVTFSRSGQVLRWQLGGGNVCIKPGTSGDLTLYVQITDMVADGTSVTNTVVVGEDSPGTEDIVSNNSDSSSTRVYRANISVQKTGTSVGEDGVLGTADDSTSVTNPNEVIHYTITYDNSGNTDAADTIISDRIPTDACFVIGSILPPAGTITEYSSDNESTWTYIPSGASGDTDCNITNFRVVFTSPLPAPATFDSEDSKTEFDSSNSAKSFIDTQTNTPGSVSLAQVGGLAFGGGILNNNNTSCLDTGADPIPVCTPDDLDQVRNYVGSNFIVMNDIDFVTYDNDMGTSYTTTPGWVPITGFTGSFDGNYKKISGLFIEQAGSGQNALFSTTEANALIKDLLVDNATVISVGNAAILVADARNTTLQNVHVQGSVTQSNVGDKLFGGLTAILVDSSVVGSSANTTITIQRADLVGGLSGYLVNSTVSRSKSTGTISADSIYGVGGLIGIIESGDVSNSYTETNIQINVDGKEIGGFVGSLQSGQISDSYSYNSTVTGYSVTGGFVGTNDGTIVNSFAANQTTGNGDPGGFASRGSGTFTNVAYNEDPATPLGVCINDNPANPDCATINNDLAYFNLMTNEPLLQWDSGRWIADTTNSRPPRLLWESTSYKPNGRYTTLIDAGSTITSWDRLIYTQQIPASTGGGGIVIPSNYQPYDWGADIPTSFGTTDATDTYLHSFFGIVNGNVVDSINIDNNTVPFDSGTHGGIIATDVTTIQTALDTITSIMGYPGQAIYTITTGNQITIWLSPSLATEIANSTFVHMYAGNLASPGGYTRKVDFTNLSPLSTSDILIPSGGGPSVYITVDIQDVSGGVCSGHSLLGSPITTSSPSVAIDISSIPSTYTQLCLVTDLYGTPVQTPELTSWMATYRQSDLPNFSYDVRVNSAGFTTSTINNTVNATTSTPEISTNDNNANYSHALLQQDLSVTKSVNLAAINLTDIANSIPLTYMIHVTNNGLSPALHTDLADYLPPFVGVPTSITPTITSNGDTVTCSYDTMTHSVYCDDDGDNTNSSILSLDQGEYFDLTIVAPVLISTTVSDTIVNVTEASSGTFDTNTLNNTSSATTVVGDFANMTIQKNGPVTTGINRDITYTINYGNNGNLTANDVRITDTLPTEDADGNGILTIDEDFNSNNVTDLLVDYVAYSQISGTASLICGTDGLVVYCNSDGTASGTGVTMQPGETGSISVTLHSHNNIDMLIHSARLLNQVSIETTTPQTNINDDLSTSTSTITASDLSSISGNVWLDNSNNGDDAVLNPDDSRLQDVSILLSGIDIYGKIYGPDKSIYPQEYEKLLADLSAQCLSGSISPSCPTALTSGTVYLSTQAEPIDYIVIAPQVTDFDGRYGFTGLKPGTYNLLELQPAEWRSLASDGGFLGYNGATPNTDPSRDGEGSVELNNSQYVNSIGGNGSPAVGIVLYEGDNSIENNFIEGGGTIGNFVYQDMNNNGLYDGGDTPLATVELTLYRDINENGILEVTDTPIATRMTDGAGLYLFTDLAVGTLTGSAHYIVRVTDSAHTTDSHVAVLGTPNTDNNGQNNLGYTVVLDGTKYTDTTADFGFAPLASVGNRVWYDSDKNGLQDSGETGVAGITVQLLSGTTVAATEVTDGMGSYAFSNIAPGNYSIRLLLPSGYSVTSQDVGPNNGIDSDINHTTGQTSVFSLNPGENNVTIDAGLYPTDPLVILSSIGDMIWYDSNANNIKDASETGLAGIELDLIDSTTSSVVAHTVTDTNGLYEFAGLLPGSYSVHITLPSGLQLVTAESGADTTIDSDFSQSTNESSTIVLLSGTTLSDIDGGLVLAGGIQPGSITGTVWYDQTNDNIQGGAETGVPGQTVELVMSDGTVMSSTISGADGTYAFTNVLPGAYYVRITPSSGWQLVTQNQGGDETTDSDPNPFTRITGTYTITSGETFNDVDAGMTVITSDIPGSIRGVAWLDANSDGIMVSETTLSSVEVRLYAQDGTLVSVITTSMDGNYLFENILPGDYFLSYDLPSGYAFTLQDRGTDDTIDSDVNPSSGTTSSITLGSGQHLENINVGATNTASVGDTLFYDYNGNGAYEPGLGDRGISGVQVDIYDDTDTSGSLTVADTIVSSVLTDSNGNYMFTGLVPDNGSGLATYIIVANSNNLVPGSYTATLGLANTDNQSQIHNGYPVTVSPTDLAIFHADFGWQPDANLVDPPSIRKTYTATGEKVLEWKMVWINQSAVGPVLASLNDPLNQNQQYIPGSIQCQARGISTTTACSMDTSGVTPVVRWTGSVGADLGHTTESSADNEIVITFSVKLMGNDTVYENQACGNWDQNGDSILDSQDSNIQTNSPVCSDDPVTTTIGDPTRYVIATQTPPLVNTGKKLLPFVLLSAIISLVTIGLCIPTKKGVTHD